MIKDLPYNNSIDLKELKANIWCWVENLMETEKTIQLNNPETNIEDKN